MRLSPDELLAYLSSLGIDARTVRHPPLHTVEESKALRGAIPGGHTKNLFLRDRKDRHFLLTVPEDATVDLKAIHQVIGASGKVSFGKPDMLMALLGVEPGAVTILGAVNDRDGHVTICIDEALMREETVNVHPLTTEATTSMQSRDIRSFVEATGHELHVLKLTA